MKPTVFTKSFTELPISQKEILRYAGCKTATSETLSLLNVCLKELDQALVFKVCYCELPVEIKDSNCDFSLFSVRSNNLAKNLEGCRSVVVFCATVGIELDRLIAKYSRFSPSKALMFQAIGTERIEAVCDAFCEELKREKKSVLRPRFSCGYGDLPLDTQKEIFSLLQCQKHIGVYLNESLLMIPSKSVTAFVGVDGPYTR